VDPHWKLVHILHLENGRYVETMFTIEDEEPLTSTVLPELRIDIKQVFANMLED